MPAHKHHNKPKKEVFRIPSEIIIGVIVAIVIIAAIFILTRSPSTANGKVVATVNGQPITEKDIQELNLTISPNQRSLVTKDVLLDQAINQILIEQEAARRGIKVTDDEVNALVKTMLSQLNLSESALEAKLAEQGLNVAFLKKLYAKQLIAVKLFNETTASSVTVTSDEVNRYYNASSNVSRTEIEGIRNIPPAAKGKRRNKEILKLFVL